MQTLREMTLGKNRTEDSTDWLIEVTRKTERITSQTETIGQDHGIDEEVEVGSDTETEAVTDTGTENEVAVGKNVADLRNRVENGFEAELLRKNENQL